MEKLVDLVLSFLQKNWKNKQSEIFLNGMLFIIPLTAYILIEAICGAANNIGAPIGVISEFLILDAWSIKLGLIIILELSGILLWLQWRKLPVFSKSKIGIYLVPYFSDSKILEIFMKNFKNDLEGKIGDIADIVSLTSPYFYNELSQLHKDADDSNNHLNKKEINRINKYVKKLKDTTNVNYIILGSKPVTG